MPTIEFRIDVTGVPHSFIVMDNGAGVLQGFGFAPKEENSPYGSGWIYDNIEHEYDFTTGPIEVTTEQYNAMVDYINNSIHNPPDYNLPGSLFFPSSVQQCAQWVMDVAQHGNVTLPFTMHRGGWNPYGQAIWINFDEISDTVASFFTTATAAVRRDPLTFDLDGDGIETVGISATSPILFDHDADGVKTATGWIKSDDALLVRDINGNGTIDNGRELFGDATLKTSGQLAKDGFDALADMDSNADGKIDSADTGFASLRLWRDLDQDGISQSGELFTLESQNIVSINVANTDHLITLTDGSGRVAVQQRGIHRRTPCGCNQIADLGSYTKTDGSTGSITSREILITQILFASTSADAYASNSRGDYLIDACHLYVIEALMGELYIQVWGTYACTHNAAAKLEAIYGQLIEYIYGQLTAQTALKLLYDSITYHWDATTQTIQGDLSAVAAQLTVANDEEWRMVG